MTRWSVLRAGLAFLAASQVAVGTWQLLAPRAFFGLAWVAAYPPYNEHLMRDVGALGLSLAVVLAVAARAAQRSLALTALVAYLVWSVPHLVFHTTHMGHFSTVDAAAMTAVLSGVVVLALALLAAAVGAPVRVPPGRDARR